ncbi:hypothetical protein [Rhizobium sp. AQ_MP]|uniref:hypothetical protein n=1 Tax=Rhizobium sp. AQ_MP TaxID=2761536 RepID=UPI001FEE2878|nr:hypothetical protein [Rhizobium sp. AQ_MP]
MKKFLVTTSMICMTASVLSACTTDGASQSPPMAAATQPLMDESVPPAARSACLAAVSNTTNNGDVEITEMIFSEANSQVTVGVGPTRAPWRCLVSNSGVVANVMSLTNEGSL